jgi:hypothetical protein
MSWLFSRALAEVFLGENPSDNRAAVQRIGEPSA